MFKKIDILPALTQLLFGILGALLVQIIFVNSTQKIATIDIVSIVKSFESELIKQKLPPDEVNKKVTQFSESLNSIPMLYAKKNHIILVPKEVVLAGSSDKTDEIKELIKKRMNP